MKQNDTLIAEIAKLGNIDLSVFVDAGRWTYSDPEGTAARNKTSYENSIIANVHKILNFANEQDAALAEKLAIEFVQGYKTRYEKCLYADSRCASSFITGGSNFPVARMQKRNDIAHKRTEELLNYCEWKMNKIKNTLQPTIIKSADEMAIVKLDEKLKGLEESQVLMKAFNKVIKKWQKSYSLENSEDVKALIAELKIIHPNDKFISEALKPNYMGKIGFPSWALTNNNATIRNTKKRLEKLKADADMAAKIENGEMEVREYLFDDGKVLYNYEAQRVQILFDGIPSEEIRKALKKISCRWSPKNSAWQMHLKEWNYKTAIETIKELYSKEEA